MTVATIDRTTAALWEYQGEKFYGWTRAGMEKAVSRVNQGALLLDDEKSDWEQEVLPTDLDMSSASFCIIGQVYGDYDTDVGIPFGMEHLMKDGEHDDEITEKATEHGFLAPRDDDEVTYELLDRVWVYLLTERATRKETLTLRLLERDTRNVSYQLLADANLLAYEGKERG